MSFDTLAPYYRMMEWVAAGGVLQRCRTAFLAETRNSRRALLLGEGPGRFLEELLRTNPRVEVTCVERSPRMIEEAQKRLNESELARVQFVQADALTWQPLTPSQSADPFLVGLSRCDDPARAAAVGTVAPLNAALTAQRAVPAHARFDLIVTHFFLDCFRREELSELVAKVAATATEDARWLLADFREPESGWQRLRGRAVLALMYGFFRVATGLSASELTAPDRFLEAGGFRLASRQLANFGLAHADLWQRNAA